MSNPADKQTNVERHLSSGEQIAIRQRAPFDPKDADWLWEGTVIISDLSPPDCHVVGHSPADVVHRLERYVAGLRAVPSEGLQ
jgi:phosphatidylserine decarboxylase